MDNQATLDFRRIEYCFSASSLLVLTIGVRWTRNQRGRQYDSEIEEAFGSQ
jgi:hypothetical protein